MLQHQLPNSLLATLPSSTMSRPSPPPPRRDPFPRTHLFLLLLSIRLLNAVTLRTFFQPDEYFQSLEPAWEITFGPNSGAWITWEWREKLRSIAHPMIFAYVYKVADMFMNTILHLEKDSRLRGEILIIIPRMFMALFATVGDWYTMEFARKVLGDEGGWNALFLSLGSAFHWFCSTRTFSNSLEANLTAIALYYWPWALGPKDAKIGSWKRNFNYSLILAGIACVLRPTNALIWGFLGFLLLLRSTSEERIYMLKRVVRIGTTTILFNVIIDYTHYNKFVFPPYTFLKFNLIQSLSIFYGRMPWHYYLSQGLPLLLTTYLPLAIHQLCTTLETTLVASPSQKDTTKNTTLLELTLTTMFLLLTYSLLPHKEIRFIYPLLPIFLLLTTSSFSLIPIRPKILLPLLITLNIPLAYYTTQIHQRGVVDVTNYLRQTRSQWETVGFLMPCHSTPWQSHLQLDPHLHSAWALSCEPPLSLPLDTRDTYKDEADMFYEDEKAFLKSFLPTKIPSVIDGFFANSRKRMWEETKHRRWPDRLVFFKELEERVLREYLGEIGGLGLEDGDDGGRKKEVQGGKGEEIHRYYYVPCARFFNSHWHDDWRRRGDVVVYCLRRNSSDTKIKGETEVGDGEKIPLGNGL